MRNRGKQIVHERRLHLLASKLLFDVHVRRRPESGFRAAIHEGAVSEIGRDSASRGMRLVHVAVLFELRQDVANCGRGQTETAPARDDLRRHRLSAVDVLAHQRRQQAT